MSVIAERLAADTPLTAASAKREFSNFIGRKKNLETPFLEWALRVPEPKSGPLDFERFPFQPGLYEAFGSDAPEVVVMKGTQLGVSALAARWAMYGPDIRRVTALYVFPTKDHAMDWSDSRLRPCIDGSEYLRTRVPAGHIYNKSLKQIGLGYLFLRGSESKRGLQAIDADWLVLDENDDLVADNIPDAEQRLSGSLQPLIRRLGVPTEDATGIAQQYEDSDQRRWMLKCEHCREGFQEIDFFESVHQPQGGEPYLGCKRCLKPLDVTKGQWVAKYPDRHVPGFHVSRLLVPGVNLRSIIKASQAREPFKVAHFWNKHLGLPHSETEGRLSKEALAAAQRDFTMVPGFTGKGQDYLFVSAGIDVHGKHNFYVRISLHLDERTKRALWIGEVENLDELCRLMDRYEIDLAVIDEGPEMRLARGFAERFLGRAYVHRFAQNQRDVISVDEEQHRVVTRRVEAIDACLEMIRQRRNQLPLDLPNDYVKQMRAPSRRAVRDEVGRTQVVYRSQGADHYALAETLDLIASEVWWLNREVSFLAAQERVVLLEDVIDFERISLDFNEPLGDLHLGPPENEFASTHDYGW